jgi:chromosomal replication initiation ATPase DnaA
MGIDENPFKDVEAGIILGDKRFKTKIMGLIDKIEADEEIPQIKRLRENVPIDTIIKTCSSFYGKIKDDLVKRGKNKPERQIAIYLSKVLSGKKNKEVGKYFGIKGPAVSEVIKSIEGRLENEKVMKKDIERLKEILKMTDN